MGGGGGGTHKGRKNGSDEVLVAVSVGSRERYGYEYGDHERGSTA